MPSQFRLILFAGLLVTGSDCCANPPQIYYVDAHSGEDGNNGLTPAAAWRTLAQVNRAPLIAGDSVLFQRGNTWRGQLRPKSGAAGAPITYGAYGSGPRPRLLGSTSRDKPEDWHQAGPNLWATAPRPAGQAALDPADSSADAAFLSVDVGNILFDQGKAVSFKKWKREDLQRPGDFWYSAANGQVLLYSERNPASVHHSIELALKRHIVSEGNCSHVTYESLALLYGAAHGIGGGNTHHIVVRNCDIAWMGGGHQLDRPDGKPVRYGNGIEFWGEAHDNVVEGCRLWEIYDAALTNQGGNHNTAADITYRDNVIWNCEYSFEYWNGKGASKASPQRSHTRNIRFEHNTCVNAGYGWGHAQRPDPNGRHLMFYPNPVETSGFVVEYNIFARATDSCVRFWNDWTAGLTMDRNCWYQQEGTLVLFLKTPFTSEQFGEYQSTTHLDTASIVADPLFVDVEARDFRLAPASPARSLGGNGEPAGSRLRLSE